MIWKCWFQTLDIPANFQVYVSYKKCALHRNYGYIQSNSFELVNAYHADDNFKS